MIYCWIPDPHKAIVLGHVESWGDKRSRLANFKILYLKAVELVLYILIGSHATINLLLLGLLETIAAIRGHIWAVTTRIKQVMIAIGRHYILCI